MATITNNELWRSFIDKYRSLPELWKIKCDNYKNKNLRAKAWDSLLETFREIEPNANLDAMKKRINNMRACYRRELKKIEKTEASGAGEDEIYEPTLWYFDEMEFLRDQETQLPGISTCDNEGEGDIENITEELTENQQNKRRKNLNKKNEPYRDLYLKSAVEHLEKMREDNNKEKDEAATYAESWAVSYRKLSEEQQLYAKKAIEEIFVLGQLGQLTLNSVTTPTNTRVSTPLSIQPCESTPPHNLLFLSPTERQFNNNNNKGFSYTQLLQDPQYQ